MQSRKFETVFIRVTETATAEMIQDHLFSLGYKWNGDGQKHKYLFAKVYVGDDKGSMLFNKTGDTCHYMYKGKELFLPEKAVVASPETNPKKQFGDKSLPLSIWPALASAYGCLGLYNGKLKYGQSNFNATPVEASIYIAGAMRHLAAWSEGEEFDPADGVPNLGGVLANIAIILEARAAGTLIDDRKLGSGYLKERDALKEIVASLQILHKYKEPKHYTLKDTK